MSYKLLFIFDQTDFMEWYDIHDVSGVSPIINILIYYNLNYNSGLKL